MGQYYHATVLKQNWKNEQKPVEASLSPYDYDNGAKLMEHSYVHNNYVEAAMRMIDIVGQGKAVPFVWIGDYADRVETNVYPFDGTVNEYNEPNGGVDIYSETCELVDKNKPLMEAIANHKPKSFKYIVNETKKCFVKIPRYNKDKWTLHPLPILCSSGNGRGGGDYRGSLNENSVGLWAYDEIRVTNTKPDQYEYQDGGWVLEDDEW